MAIPVREVKWEFHIYNMLAYASIIKYDIFQGKYGCSTI